MVVIKSLVHGTYLNEIIVHETNHQFNWLGKDKTEAVRLINQVGENICAGSKELRAVMENV